MRALIQRVKEASVSVNKHIISSIDYGLLVLLGVEPCDTDADIKWLAKKVCNLRIFDNDDGVMDRSLIEVAGQCLVVSQFTLYASCKKGNRPSWSGAATADFANIMYKKFIQEVKNIGVDVYAGQFQANMQVSLLNDGPVTIMLDTKE